MKRERERHAHTPPWASCDIPHIHIKKICLKKVTTRLAGDSFLGFLVCHRFLSPCAGPFAGISWRANATTAICAASAMKCMNCWPPTPSRLSHKAGGAHCFNVESTDSRDHSCSLQLELSAFAVHLNQGVAYGSIMSYQKCVCLHCKVSICYIRFGVFWWQRNYATSSLKSECCTLHSWCFVCVPLQTPRWEKMTGKQKHSATSCGHRCQTCVRWALDLPCSTVGYAHIGDGHILINKVLCTRDVRQSEWWDDHIPSTVFFIASIDRQANKRRSNI